MKKYLWKLVFAAVIVIVTAVCWVQTPITEAIGSSWALLPPIVAIGLALITKEVYSSLFIGIVTGGVIYAAASATGLEGMFAAIVSDGLIASLSDSYNVGILLFLAILGIIVVLMNRAGGSRAYGEWAASHIHSRRGAGLASVLLGSLIFVDDYFNCLTVGSVMRPVTDKHQISRAKLAYIIDATAAPICIIAPISSWAAAVSGTVEGVNGIALFISTIPFNLYAILTLLTVVSMLVLDIDFGPMRWHEVNARKGDFLAEKKGTKIPTEESASGRGKVIDLILPVAMLIICCVGGMIYSGGFFSGKSFVDAFAGCDASYGLSLGALIALLLIIVYYLLRRVLTFQVCMESIPDGVKQMVPAILILTFAWTLKSVTGQLEAGTFICTLVKDAAIIRMLLPAILFVVALGLAFATGTSWGTFSILIPIVTDVFSAELVALTDVKSVPVMVIICISACLAGAVCGDHCSPISDTTIMASTGAQCDHVDHVSTQLPYALMVAAICLIGYLIAGVLPNVYIVLGTSVVCMIAVLLCLKLRMRKQI